MASGGTRRCQEIVKSDATRRTRPRFEPTRSSSATAARYAAIPVVADFELAVDPSQYTALPDDWVLGVADVVTSTEASTPAATKP